MRGWHVWGGLFVLLSGSACSYAADCETLTQRYPSTQAESCPMTWDVQEPHAHSIQTAALTSSSPQESSGGYSTHVSVNDKQWMSLFQQSMVLQDLSPPAHNEEETAFSTTHSGVSDRAGSRVLRGEERVEQASDETGQISEYRVGVDDLLEITILQPEQLVTAVTVGPDGSISFPFIGSVQARGLTIARLNEEIGHRLSDGYMKYPVVSVSLKESRSRKFFVYGEVTHPGSYPIQEYATVLRGISMAGGFTKYGSSSHVKVLRPHPDRPGYDMLKINIKAIMAGDAQQDLVLEPGDILVVSEGVF